MNPFLVILGLGSAIAWLVLPSSNKSDKKVTLDKSPKTRVIRKTITKTRYVKSKPVKAKEAKQDAD